MGSLPNNVLDHIGGEGDIWTCIGGDFVKILENVSGANAGAINFNEGRFAFLVVILPIIVERVPSGLTMGTGL